MHACAHSKCAREHTHTHTCPCPCPCAAPCAALSVPQMLFCTVAGLRGSLSLILLADFIIASDFHSGSPNRERRVEWTAVGKSVGPVLCLSKGLWSDPQMSCSCPRGCGPTPNPRRRPLPSPAVNENADLVLWVAAFVLLSLLINAPMVSPVMTWTGLAKASPTTQMRPDQPQDIRI